MILRQIVQALFVQLLAAVLLVGLLLFLEHQFIKPPIGFDAGTLRELLSVTAQVAGVFLGLYFTAVSVVASTAYSRVPGDVRTLLTREKVGNLYIRGVAFLATVCLLLLGARAVGLKPGVLNLSVVVLLAAAAVLSFLALGLRIFHFFDPTRLVGYLAQDFMDSASAATASGFRWSDPSFQAHYQRQAEQVLNTYRRVVTLAEREKDIEGGILAELASRALVLLGVYGGTKLRIPSDSHWFRRVYEHRSWLTADHTRTQIALQTGTGLAPEPVPDPLWVESEIGGLVAEIVQRLIASHNYRDAVGVTEALAQTLAALGSRLEIDEALSLQRAVAPIAREVGRKYAVETELSEEKAQELSLLLGLTDSYGAALLSLILGISERLRSTTGESFQAEVIAIDWGHSKTLYGGHLPRKVIQQLEYVKKGIDAERLVEQRIVSPAWYREQIAALGLARLLESVVKRLIQELDETFPREVEGLVQAGQFLFAAQLLQRGLEACNKFAVHFRQFKACFERLEALRRVPDIPWPTIDWNSYESQIESARERLVVAFGQSAAGLMAVPRSRYWPDYFGHACLLLAQECYGAMAMGKEDLFRRLFPAFFLVALTAHGRLRDELQDRGVEAALIFSTEPIENLLELSGWAIVYSELDGRGFWEIAREIWDKYFSTQQTPQNIAEFINAMVSYRQSLFALLPGDLTRSAWKQDFAGRLRERGLLSEDEFLSRARRERVQHESAIVRVVSRGGDFLISDPEDIFMAVYLFKRPEASGLTPTNRAREFQEMLEREEARGTSTDESDDDEDFI